MRSEILIGMVAPSSGARLFASPARREMEAIFHSRRALPVRGATPISRAIVAIPPPDKRPARKALVIGGAMMASLCAIAAGISLLALPVAEAPQRTVVRPPQSATPRLQLPIAAASSPQPAKILPAVPPVTDLRRTDVTETKSTVSRPTKPAKKPPAAKPKRAQGGAYINNPNCIGLGSEERSRCMHPKLVAADRGLRGAYDDAIRAGVSPEVLAPYRSRWTRLLRQADSDPHHVTAVLGSMARQLDDERARARTAGL